MPQSKQLRSVNGGVAQPQSLELPIRDETLHVPDLEGQLKDKDELSGRFRLCQQQQRDTRLMVLPRFTEIYSHCLIDLGSRVSSLEAELKRTDKAGESNPELLNKLEQTTFRYGQFLLQAQKIHALDQPNRGFLRNLVTWNRSILKDDDTGFVEEPLNDWVSVTDHDRLDQFITLIPATSIGRVLAWPFRSNTEMVGENMLDDYHEGVMKFAIFTVFSLILGVFTCAPAGIQSLNVVSTIGEVAVYVAFVIVFGWLSLGLFRGFERPLLTSLAFAGLMANLLRGNN